MCICLILLVPEGADLPKAIALGTRCGFAPRRPEQPELPQRWLGALLLEPDDSQCCCGTSLGSLHREVVPEAVLERQSHAGRRANWSESRRLRWRQQRQQAAHRTPGPISAGADTELDRWLAFALAAGQESGVGSIGVVKQNFDEGVRHWLPPVRVRASIEALRRVAWRTPTWLDREP